MRVSVPRIVAVLSVVGLVLSLVVPAVALADPPKTILYLVRHGETQTKLKATGVGTFAEECNATRSCCTVILNPLGQERADALADWFVTHRLAATLTHLLGTNKPRTVETLQGLADVTGLPIVQTPPETECAPGFLITQGSKALAIAAIQALPLDSRAVIANHSDTMYEIMRVALGLDTSDPIDFPKQLGTTDRIDGFNNLWIVEVDGSGHGRLIQHVAFDLQLEGRVVGLGRARGVGDGEDIHDPSE